MVENNNNNRKTNPNKLEKNWTIFFLYLGSCNGQNLFKHKILPIGYKEKEMAELTT